MYAGKELISDKRHLIPPHLLPPSKRTRSSSRAVRWRSALGNVLRRSSGIWHYIRARGESTMAVVVFVGRTTRDCDGCDDVFLLA